MHFSAPYHTHTLSDTPYLHTHTFWRPAHTHCPIPYLNTHTFCCTITHTLLHTHTLSDALPIFTVWRTTTHTLLHTHTLSDALAIFTFWRHTHTLTEPVHGKFNQVRFVRAVQQFMIEDMPKPHLPMVESSVWWGISICAVSALYCRVLPCVAVCCRVLQCVAVCCRLLQCVAVYSTVWRGIHQLPTVESSVWRVIHIYIVWCTFCMYVWYR